MGSSHSKPGEPCNQDSHLPDLYEASIADLERGLSLGHFTTVDLVKAYLARIEEVNLNGPNLRAVLETNPMALAQAAVADDERKRRPTDALGLLHGIPILVKDNMATSHEEGMNTTAGSYALLGSVVPRDATVVSHLRDAGAIILGKSNLSEWSSFRGVVPSGFSGRGGQGTSPYYPLLDPSGSSSGSAVAAAIGLAAGALGTETTGSIVLPASVNNIVGLKPTVGLTSRAGVIPISSHQDSVGPMARTVEDVAILLSVIAGRDELDPATMNQPQPVPDYRKALDVFALRGARFGVPRKFQSHGEPSVDATFDQAIELIRAQGGVVVDPADFPDAEEILKSRNEAIVLDTDFKIGLNKYLSELKEVPTGVKTLADLISFNTAHADQELIPPFYADQSQLIAADATVVDEKYLAALAANADLGRARGVDATLKKYNLDAILLPTADRATIPPAIAGYPILSVPLGFQPEDTVPTKANPIVQKAPGAPFGISFAGTAFSEFKLISLAFAYEQATRVRLGRRAYEAAVPKIQLADVIAERRRLP